MRARRKRRAAGRCELGILKLPFREGREADARTLSHVVAVGVIATKTRLSGRVKLYVVVLQ